MKATITDAEGNTIVSQTLEPKTFSTGSTGAFASFKAECDGVRYQVMVQAVKIGSKPQAKAKR